jgi:hypothetical protein
MKGVPAHPGTSEERLMYIGLGTILIIIILILLLR